MPATICPRRRRGVDQVEAGVAQVGGGVALAVVLLLRVARLDLRDEVPRVGLRLTVLALGAQVRKNLLDAELIDNSEALSRDLEPHETLLALEPKALRVQIRQEAATRLVVRMGNLVADHRPLSRDLAHLGHRTFLKRALEGAGTIPGDCGLRQGEGAQIQPRSASETCPPRLTTT